MYLYIDPRDGHPFYAGMGKGHRVLSHLHDPTVGRKTGRIAELRALGLDPRLEILAHGLSDEESAFRVEAVAIDLLRLGPLTNLVNGKFEHSIGANGRTAIARLPKDLDPPAVRPESGTSTRRDSQRLAPA